MSTPSTSSRSHRVVCPFHAVAEVTHLPRMALHLCAPTVGAYTMAEATRAHSQDVLDKPLFFTAIIDHVPGFLDPYAAKRTMDLLEYQEGNEIAGSLYEVGLFYGKYFSVLLRSATLRQSRIVGIDTFEYLTSQDFSASLSAHLAPDRQVAQAFMGASILQQRSGDLSARKLLAHLGEEARFVSIDGSHEYEDVLWDLSVADGALSAEGVIAVDDFLHPISLGVTAAVFHYLERSVTLVPFAHVCNKLFLSRPAWADRYRSALEAAILADATDAKSIEYRSHAEIGARVQIEAAFRGYRILTIRL